MKRIIGAILSFVLLLGLISFQADADPSVGKDVGNKAADFSLLNQDNQMTKFSSATRGKRALLYFYMACCADCGQRLKKLSDINQTLSNNKIEMMGVQYFGNTQMCQVSAKKYKFPGSVMVDSKGEVCARYGVGDFTVITINAEGVILYRGNGDDAAAIKRSLQIN